MAVKPIELRLEGSRKAVVVMEGDDRDEIDESPAVEAAMVYARQQGFPARGFSSRSGAYPVADDGWTPQSTVRTGPGALQNSNAHSLNNRKIVGYRNDITLLS